MDVDEQVGVSGRVGTRKGHEGRTGSASTAVDADLGAREVELSSVGVEGLVESNVLEANEILAIGNAARNRDGDGALACVILLPFSQTV